MNQTFTSPKVLIIALAFIAGCSVNNVAFGQEKPIPPNQPFVCGTPDADITPEIQALMQRSKRLANARVKDDTRYAYRISVDIDSDTYFQYNGDIVAIKRDVLNSMAVVSRVFETEVNIKVSVVNIHIQRDSLKDPYKGETDIFKLLDIADKRFKQTPDFPNAYDALIYLPTKAFSGAGGVGYLGKGVNVSPLGRISTIAHEMGHNLGSPHTHACSWEGGPLDYAYPVEGDCYKGAVESRVGTIMSYSGGGNLQFHPQVRAVFRAFVEKNLTKITSAPDKIKLADSYDNAKNKPYLPFTPDAKADQFVVQTAKSATFDSVLNSDTAAVPLLHLRNMADNGSLFVRVKASNSFGESGWSNVSEIKNGNGLKTPIPKAGSHLAVREVFRQNIQLDFSAVENATGYEVNVDPFFVDLLRASYSDTFRVSAPGYYLEQYPYRQNNIRWRVRAVNATEKSAWSDFQTIIPNMKADIFGSFDYADPQELPLQVSFTSLQSADFQTSQFVVRDKATNKIVDTYTSGISGFMASAESVFQPKGLSPGKTYVLSTKTTNILPDYKYGVPVGFSQSSDIEFKTTAVNTTGLITYYGTRGGDLGRRINALAFTDKYAFVANEAGISRLKIATDSSTIFDRTNTQGGISNRSQLQGTDDEGNLWMVTQVSKRTKLDGVFPVNEYSIRKYNPETMQVLKSYDAPFEVDYIDMQEMVVSTVQGTIRKFYKILKNELQPLDEFKDTSFDRHEVIDITPRFYWLESTSQGYREIARIDRKDKSVKLFSRNVTGQTPYYFSYVISKEEKLLISALDQGYENTIRTYAADRQASQTTLALPDRTSNIQSMEFDNYGFLHVLSTKNRDGRLQTYSNGIWKQGVDLPKGFNSQRRYISLKHLSTDKQGNVWLNNYYDVKKITRCGKTTAPNLTFEGGKQADSLTLFAKGCTTTSWKLISDNGGFSQFFTDANSLKIKNAGSTIQVSCVQDGCVSNPAITKIGGVTAVSLTASSKKAACPGDSLDLSVSLQGLFEKENTVSTSLIFDGKTYDAGTSTGSGEIRVKIPGSFQTAGKATLRVTTSAPKITSNDFTIDILPRPAISIVSNDMICKNGELLLRAVSIDTTVSFKWYVANAGTVSGTAGSFRINSAGDFRLEGIDGKGCTNEISRTIQFYPVDPKVTITGDSILCRGTAPKLNALASGAKPFTFSWKKRGQAINAADSSVIIRETGSYSVAATDKNGCLTNAAFSVKASTLTDVVITSENNADLIPIDGMVLQVPAATGWTYLWYKNDQPLAGETKSTLAITETGTYKVQLTEGNCQYVTAAASFAVILSAENNRIDAGLLLYPNPVQDQLVLKFKNVNSKTMLLYSGSGQFIKGYDVIGEKLKIDVSNLPAGPYFLKNDSGTQTTLYGRFVKQ